MTQPTDLPIITPPTSSPEEASAAMRETAQVITDATGVVVAVSGDKFVVGNVRLTIDQVIATLCQEVKP